MSAISRGWRRVTGRPSPKGSPLQPLQPLEPLQQLTPLAPPPPSPNEADADGSTPSPLLEPALLARLERLQLTTRTPLAGRLGGEHRSPRRGSSLDFADYRPYFPGDDYRRIDYHLLARLDLLLLKLFEAEDDLSIRLLIDTSASMSVAGKLGQATRLAGAIGFVGLVRRDTVSVHTISRDGLAATPRFVGRGAVSPFFRHLTSLTASGPTPFAQAARHVLASPGPVGHTVVFSDLLTPDWEEGLVRLPGRGATVTIVHVLGPHDLEPDQVGDLDLLDVESGRRIPVSLTPHALQQFHEKAHAWADSIASRCHHVGVNYVRVDSQTPIEPLLVGEWRRAGILR